MRLSIPSKEEALAIVGSKGKVLLPRVQRLTWDVTVNSTDDDELGNPRHAGTQLDMPEVTVSFSVLDTGIKTFAVLTGNDPDAYPSSGVDISDLGEIDAIIYVKDESVKDFAKSAHAKRLQLRDFSFSYSVDGQSTEEYSAIGSEKRWFKYDVVVDEFSTGTTTFNLSQTPIQLKNGNYLISVINGGKYLQEVTGTPSAGEYSISSTVLTLGESRNGKVIAVYHANPTGNNWEDVSDSSMPSSIKGKDVKIVISAREIPRVQSVTINGNLRPEPVKELGNRSIVGYQRQVPTVEGTLTVLDTDTELIALLTNAATNDVEFMVEGGSCATSGIPLEIKLLDPCDQTYPYTVLKTIYIPNITIAGESYSINVNGNASQVFNFRSATGECYVFSGARV